MRLSVLVTLLFGPVASAFRWNALRAKRCMPALATRAAGTAPEPFTLVQVGLP